MPNFIEVTRGAETVIIDPDAVVAVQHRGESHFIHTSGGATPVSRELAVFAAGGSSA